MKFDIVEFYPSITKDLLYKTFLFAKSLVHIPDGYMIIIMHCRKSFLFDSNNIWTKQQDPDFDVTMGSFDGAEVCEFVGLYLLNLLKDVPELNSTGLYSDDGLACFKKLSGPQAERMKKKIIKIFKDNGLRITVENNLVRTDFLDVTLDLEKIITFHTKNPIEKYCTLTIYVILLLLF